MLSLFDLLDDEQPQIRTISSHLAKPNELKDPPNLSGVKAICLDWETTGLRWWAGDKPVGGSVCLPNGLTHYLAWGHRGGGNNISEEGAQAYFNAIEGIEICNLNTRFEEHMKRAWTGRGFDAQGCRLTDVSHYVALLEDQRFELNQKAIVRDYLTDEAKVEKVGDITLDPSRMASYHADIVAVRANGDTRQVHKLKQVLIPMLEAQGLMRVKDLEDRFIPVVVEMEHNGTLIDVPLLDTWIVEAEAEWKACIMQLYRNTGLSIDPGSDKDMAKLFRYCKVSSDELTPGGKPSYKADVLKRLAYDPNIKLALRVKQLKSLESKYLHKYRRNVDSKGILRYAIHQLRASKERGGDDSMEAHGTGSGRCSSSAFTFQDAPDEGVNIQQTMKIEKQIDRYGDHYIVRQLHIPDRSTNPNRKWIRSDAKQIEYRIFASMANNKEVLEAYRKDPEMSFHKYMWKEKLLPFRPEFKYGQTKNLNFAVIYVAGLAKMAWMLDYITQTRMKELQGKKAGKDHPELRETAKIKAIYDQVLPEAGPLQRRAIHLAMSECDDKCNRTPESRDLHRKYKHRGYIETILGRRIRFEDEPRKYKGLNGAIQGTAADINKQKGIELYDAREELNILIRYTVHDEWDLDGDEDAVPKVQAVLDRQSFPKLKVPILWDVKSGNNWREASED
jgi:DNA polymerase I-like protein with 3'-5' exonuclease and polymerase domains